jgi:hypothetical protein
MVQNETQSVPAIKYDVVVQDDGRILLTVPFLPGKRVTVFVVQEQDDNDELSDFVAASGSSTDFWDNPYDDEDWNNA